MSQMMLPPSDMLALGAGEDPYLPLLEPKRARLTSEDEAAEEDAHELLAVEFAGGDSFAGGEVVFLGVSAPRPKRRRTQAEMDRQRRARVKSAVGALRAAAGCERGTDKAAVLEASLRELERLRAANAELQAAAARTTLRSTLFVVAPHGLVCQEWQTGAIVDANDCITGRLGFPLALLRGRSWPDAMLAHFGAGTPMSRKQCDAVEPGPSAHELDRIVDRLPPGRRAQVDALRRTSCSACGSPTCAWVLDEVLLLAGKRDRVASVREVPLAAGFTTRLLISRWLVRDKATGNPLYFMTMGQSPS